MTHAVRMGIEEGYIPIVRDERYTELTATERNILELLSLGFTTRETAELRSRSSIEGVKSQRKNIYRKLLAHNGHHAVRRAFEVGIFKIPEPSEAVE